MVFSLAFTIGYLALFIILAVPMRFLAVKVESATSKRLLPLVSGCSVRIGVRRFRMAGQFPTRRLLRGNALRSRRVCSYDGDAGRRKGVLIIIGIALIALAPAKPLGERASVVAVQ